MFVKAFPLVCLVATLALGSMGCNNCKRCDDKDPLTATDIQTEKMDEAIEHKHEHFDTMVDNAMLHDMSVADFHFVPHTAEISGTGAARLNRMGPLLDTYGGTVRYETFETDEALVTKRLEHVREYLATTGCEMERVQIKAMLSGGTGMVADRAILIDLKGTAKQDASGAPTAGGIGVGAAASGGQ